MSKINDGGPAFPAHLDGDYDSVGAGYGGMSLRDYFASKALQGYLAGGLRPIKSAEDKPDEIITPSAIASRAYKYADAMLIERTKHEAESDG